MKTVLPVQSRTDARSMAVPLGAVFPVSCDKCLGMWCSSSRGKQLAASVFSCVSCCAGRLQEACLPGITDSTVPAGNLSRIGCTQVCGRNACWARLLASKCPACSLPVRLSHQQSCARLCSPTQLGWFDAETVTRICSLVSCYSFYTIQ